MALGSLSRKTLTELVRNGGHFGGFVRGLRTVSLPNLPYDYGALEPAISAEIMQLHHQKHHQTYITNYNKALEQLDEAMAKGDASTVVKLQSVIKFNGGGHINHSIFWNNLAPVREGGGEPPKASLGWAIDSQFGSLESLVKKIKQMVLLCKWLALDKEQKKLSVETTANQDSLVTKGTGLVPLLGIDVWEHAYYLQYKNIKQLLKELDGEFLQIICCTEDMINRSLWEALHKSQPSLEELKIAKSLPRICFLSGLTGEEMMMFIDAFPEAGLEPAVFAAVVPNSAEKPLEELIEEIMGDHEMLTGR